MFSLFLSVTCALIVLSLVLLLAFTVYLTNARRKFAHIPSPPMARYVLMFTLHAPLNFGVFLYLMQL